MKKFMLLLIAGIVLVMLVLAPAMAARGPTAQEMTIQTAIVAGAKDEMTETTTPSATEVRHVLRMPMSAFVAYHSSPIADKTDKGALNRPLTVVGVDYVVKKPTFTAEALALKKTEDAKFAAG